MNDTHLSLHDRLSYMGCMYRHYTLFIDSWIEAYKVKAHQSDIPINRSPVLLTSSSLFGRRYHLLDSITCRMLLFIL